MTNTLPIRENRGKAYSFIPFHDSWRASIFRYIGPGFHEKYMLEFGNCVVTQAGLYLGETLTFEIEEVLTSNSSNPNGYEIPNLLSHLLCLASILQWSGSYFL